MEARHLQAIVKLGFCLLGLLVCHPIVATAQDAPATGSEVEQAVSESARQFVTAFNQADAKAIAALWTEDGEYIDEAGTRTVGRAAIEKQYADFFANNQGAKIEIAINAIQQVSPDSAIEDGHSQLTIASPAAVASGRYMAIHVKQNGQWLMASVRDSPSRPSSSANLSLQDLAWLVGDWTALGDGSEVELDYDWMGNGSFIRGETKITDEKGPIAGGSQIIGKDPVTGHLVSWFFNADGSHGYGEWSKQGAHWMIRTQGVTAEGLPTSSINILYDADDNVHSWQSINRTVGGEPLPRTKEIVIERKSDSKTNKETK
ncbi:YybH family protein [Bythopirellula goksoeyrii]|uniref:SnoaL-like domain protein n=1 Tax=Bythopirellula goksoeyrii TaxID=1400387 RepID=A0A5B9QGW6_9BACT|nr:SgcJ/EcaC family oxidoreductase [Bythopirellula goksoeyrii]QEG33503.1 SnoaL-like domain protein [Bythopirellula goksoeyrii]